MADSSWSMLCKRLSVSAQKPRALITIPSDTTWRLPTYRLGFEIGKLEWSYIKTIAHNIFWWVWCEPRFGSKTGSLFEFFYFPLSLYLVRRTLVNFADMCRALKLLRACGKLAVCLIWTNRQQKENIMEEKPAKHFHKYLVNTLSDRLRMFHNNSTRPEACRSRKADILKATVCAMWRFTSWD